MNVTATVTAMMTTNASTTASTPPSGGNDVRTSPIPEEFDMATAEKMHFVTSTIFGTIFVVVGIIGNILSILVWKRKKMQSSTGAYLIGQAVADMGLLFFFFITDSVPMMDPSVKNVYAYGAFFAFVGFPIFFLFVICSIWFTVGVTVDRYIQVCWISQAKQMCSIRRALVGLGIITLLCFIINLPHFFTYTPVRDADRNLSDPAFVPTEYGAGSGSEKYEFWVHCMFLVLAPWVSIFTLNMLIIRQIHAVNKQMDKRKSVKGAEKSRRAEAQLMCLLLTENTNIVDRVTLPLGTGQTDLSPEVSIFTLNMLIIRQIHAVNKQMDKRKSVKGAEKSRRAEAQLTRLLLTVTFTFLVLIALQCITQCFFMLKTGNRKIVSEAFSIAKLGIVINSSVNFFLYCLSGKRFRDELRTMICGKFSKTRGGSSSYSMTSETSSSVLSRTKSAAPSNS